MYFYLFFFKNNPEDVSGTQNIVTWVDFPTLVLHLTCHCLSIDTVHRNVTWLLMLRTRSRQLCGIFKPKFFLQLQKQQQILDFSDRWEEHPWLGDNLLIWLFFRKLAWNWIEREAPHKSPMRGYVTLYCRYQCRIFSKHFLMVTADRCFWG